MFQIETKFGDIFKAELYTLRRVIVSYTYFTKYIKSSNILSFRVLLKCLKLPLNSDMLRIIQYLCNIMYIKMQYCV